MKAKKSAIFIGLFFICIPTLALEVDKTRKSKVCDYEGCDTVTERDIQRAVLAEEEHHLITESIHHQVISVCRKEYLKQQGLSPKDKLEYVLDCLLRHTSDIFQHHSQNTHWSGFSVHLQHIDHSYRGQVQFDTVVPIEEQDDSKAFFFQPGFILSIREDRKPKAILSANVGLVYRFVFHKGVLGFNVFYDLQKGKKSPFQSRLGLGVDYQSHRDIFSINTYIPVQGWKSIDQFYEERPITGGELSWRRVFSDKWEGEGRVSFWDLNTKKDSLIIGVGVDYKINCSSSFGIEAEQDVSTNLNATWLRYKFFLSDSSYSKKCTQTQYENTKKTLLFQKVHREKEIRTEKRKSTPQVIIPDQYISPGESFSYTLSKNHFLGEESEVLVSSRPDWLSYDKNSMRFYGTPLQLGVYTVKGSVVDSKTKKKESLWSFKITVSNDSLPQLLVEDQTIQKGDIRDYSPLVKNVDISKPWSVTIKSISEGGLSVTWSVKEKYFEINSKDALEGTYIVIGSISDHRGRVKDWIFKITVTPINVIPGVSLFSFLREPPPILKVQEQIIIRQDETLSYRPTISRVRPGEIFTVHVDEVSEEAPLVTWNHAESQFSISANSVEPGVYTITGSIVDASDHTGYWLFIVTVIK